MGTGKVAHKPGLRRVRRLDENDRVRHRVGGMDLVLDGCPGIEARGADEFPPLALPASARVAVRHRQMEHTAALRTSPNHEPAFSCGLKEPAGVVVDSNGNKASFVADVAHAYGVPVAAEALATRPNSAANWARCSDRCSAGTSSQTCWAHTMMSGMPSA